MRGYSEQAWGLIDSNFGLFRECQLGTYFLRADLSQDSLLSKLESLTQNGFKGDLEKGLTGFLNRHSVEEFENILFSHRIKSLLLASGGIKGNFELGSGLSGILQRAAATCEPQDRPKILASAITLYSKGYLNHSGLSMILDREEIGSPSDKYDIYKSINTGNLESQEANYWTIRRGSVIAEMISQNGSAALEKILETPGDHVPNDVNSAIKEWSQLDSSGLNRWYSENQSKLSVDNKNLVASAFCTEAIAASEPDTARLWIAQVNNAEDKANLLKEIERMESAKAGDMQSK